MTDFRLKSLLAVVRTGSFSAAAEVLHLTQPAISQHVASLEELYGSELFSRSGRRSIPTAAGRLLFQYAEKVEALYRSIDRDMASVLRTERTYDVGATLTVAEYLMPGLIGAYRHAKQGVKIRLTVRNTTEVVDLVRQNRLVLGVVEGPFEEEGLRSTVLKSDELVAVCAPTHPFATRNSRRRISLKELLASDIILREPGSGTRDVFERYLAAHGFDPGKLHPLMEIGSNNAIKSLIESELGSSVISRMAVEDELKRGRLVQIPLTGPRITRELRLAWTDFSDLAFVKDFRTFCHRVVTRPPGTIDS